MGRREDERGRKRWRRVEEEEVGKRRESTM